MKSLGLILTLLLISCQVIYSTMGVKLDDYDDPFMEELYEEFKPIRSFLRRLSEEEENLKLFYNKEWLPITSKTLETVIDIRAEIIETTKKTNYLSLVSTTFSLFSNLLIITGNVAPVPNSVLSWASKYSTRILLGSKSFDILTGLGKYSMSSELCKIADIHIGTSKQYTNTFYNKLQSYFEHLEKFKTYLSHNVKSETAMLMFSRLAESKGFLKNLYFDEQTEQKLRDRLLQIIHTDTSKMKPYMRAIELAGKVYDGAKTFAGKINNMLNEMEDILNSTSILNIIIVDEMFKTNNWSKNSKPFEFENHSFDGIDACTTTVRFSVLMGLSIDSSRTLEILRQKATRIKSVASNLLKSKAVLTTFRSLLVAIDVYFAGQTIANLREGSVSVESEEMLKVINTLQNARKEVIEEIKISFGW